MSGFLIIILHYGCESEVNNVKLPDFKPSIVVSAFLTPGSEITYADVSVTKRIYGELGSDSLTGPVRLFISDETSEYELQRSQNKFYFRNEDFQILPQKTYNLKIESENYPDASAICTVPDQLDMGIMVDTFTVSHTEFGSTRKELMFRISFNDQPQKENFYRILIKYLSFNDYDRPGGYIIDEYLGLEESLFTDKMPGSDGRMNIEDKVFFQPEFYSDSAFLKVYILNTDRNYHQFHKSIDNYEGESGPFTEPTLVFSNIEGGTGIFSSYTVDSTIYRLK